LSINNYLKPTNKANDCSCNNCNGNCCIVVISLENIRYLARCIFPKQKSRRRVKVEPDIKKMDTKLDQWIEDGV
jgi:hypothetical protein